MSPPRWSPKDVQQPPSKPPASPEPPTRNDARTHGATMTDVLTHAVLQALQLVVPVRAGTVSKNIVQLIAEDHDRVRSLWQQYKMPGTTATQRQMLAWTLIREVSIHSAKEEEVMYPALAAVLGELTPEHQLREHQQLKEGLGRLDASSVADPNFDGMLQDVVEVLLHHMAEEEQDVLPRFAAATSSEHLMQLGRAFEAAKLLAPSRPHTWAPDKPPLNIITNAQAAGVDFVRDLVRFGGAPPL